MDIHEFHPFFLFFLHYVNKHDEGSVAQRLRHWTVVHRVESLSPTGITCAQLPLCALEQDTLLYLFCALVGLLSHWSHVPCTCVPDTQYAL